MGLINAVGALGGYFGPLAVGYLNQRTGNFVYAFGVLGVALLASSAVTLFFRAVARCCEERCYVRVGVRTGVIDTMLPALLLLMALSAPQLQNPGFEASEFLAGWEVNTPAQEGKGVQVRADSTEKKEGRQSLLIEARAPARYSLNQWIVLPVGTLWRARVWIRTEDLVPRPRDGSGEAGGRIVIDSREGVLGRSSPRSGTSPWQEEEVIFEAPTPEDVDIVLVGLENSAGRVWFDGLRLEPVARPVENDVRIFHQKLSKLPIDLKQCGQFIEPLCRLLPSMLAQQVESTSFEEEAEWWPSYKREIDKPHRPWYPEGAVHVAKYSLDTENPYNGKRSQKIELPVPRARAGIAQDGFYLRKGMGYRLRLHMRGQRECSGVGIALRRRRACGWPCVARSRRGELAGCGNGAAGNA